MLCLRRGRCWFIFRREQKFHQAADAVSGHIEGLLVKRKKLKGIADHVALGIVQKSANYKLFSLAAS